MEKQTQVLRLATLTQDDEVVFEEIETVRNTTRRGLN